MLTSDYSVVPLRVDVRFIHNNSSSSIQEIDKGTIAPPSTPDNCFRSQKSRCNADTKTEELQQRHRNFMQTNESEQNIKHFNGAKNSNTEEEKIHEYTLPRSMSKKSKVDSLSSYPKESERLRTYANRSEMEAKSAAPKVKLFIEKEELTHREKLVRNSLRSSTAEGYQYFRGKPALTPFSRLGCYRAQTTRKNTNQYRSTTATRCESGLPRRSSAQASIKLLRRSESILYLQRLESSITMKFAKTESFYQNNANSRKNWLLSSKLR